MYTSTHCQCADFGSSLYTPQLGGGVHAARGNQSALRVEPNAHYLGRMAAERVVTLSVLTTP